MLEAERERELVKVPVRRLPLEEKKAAELGTGLPEQPQETWHLPRRWKVY